MLKNYFTIAIRNLIKHKVYSLINILGLSIGLACCIFVLLYVQYENSWDQFHSQGDRICRVIRETKRIDGSRSFDFRTSGPLAPTLVKDFPEVEDAMRVNLWNVWSRYQERGTDLKICLADEHFLTFFDFEMVFGDHQTALKVPFGAVVSERTAQQFFGEENPLGKQFSVHKEDAAGIYTVTGVVRVPRNSTLQFDFLTAQKTSITQGMWEIWRPTQQWQPTEAFIRLREGASPEVLESKLPDFMALYMGAETRLNNTYHLEPLWRRHIYGFGHQRNTLLYLYQLTIAAGLILLVACANFMNLATAQSVHRAKEVGMRKVLGAQRGQVMTQFFSESTLLAGFAMVLALFWVEIFLPDFNDLMRRVLVLDWTQNTELIGWLMGLVLATGILAGSYPALFLSRSQPIHMVGNKSLSGIGHAGFRKVLVVFQFGISIFLIVCTGVVYKQMQFVAQKDLGFQVENLVIVPIFREERSNPNVQLSERYQAIKQAFLAHPNVLQASASFYVAGHLRSGLQPVREVNQSEHTFRARFQMVDESFLETLDIDLLEGRHFEGTVGEDTTDLPLIVNEATVKMFGWENPIGKQVDVVLGQERGTVIGVMRDFHSVSLKRVIQPLILSNRRPFWDLSLRVRNENMAETIAFFETIWRRFCSVRTFRYFFLNDRLTDQYQSDYRYATILKFTACIALFVACLGLFGLAAFTVERRTKEIGIRKVLGASVQDILKLLGNEFAWLVLVANVVAWPAAYYMMQSWLSNFVYRTSMGVYVFLFGGLVALLIAFLAIGLLALKAARANPIDALRCE